MKSCIWSRVWSKKQAPPSLELQLHLMFIIILIRTNTVKTTLFFLLNFRPLIWWPWSLKKWISQQASDCNRSWIIQLTPTPPWIWNRNQLGVMELSYGLRLVLPVGSAEKHQPSSPLHHSLPKHTGHKQSSPSENQLQWQLENPMPRNQGELAVMPALPPASICESALSVLPSIAVSISPWRRQGLPVMVGSTVGLSRSLIWASLQTYHLR